MIDAVNTITIDEYREYERTRQLPARLSGRPRVNCEPLAVDRPAATHRYEGLQRGRVATRGVMNQTEEAYLREQVEPALDCGELLWWRFEALRLRISGPSEAKAAWWTPDFWLGDRDGVETLVDVKGGIATEAAVLRAKVAATLYPHFRVLLAFRKRKRDGGGWRVVNISTLAAAAAAT